MGEEMTWRFPSSSGLVDFFLPVTDLASHSSLVLTCGSLPALSSFHLHKPCVWTSESAAFTSVLHLHRSNSALQIMRQEHPHSAMLRENSTVRISEWFNCYLITWPHSSVLLCEEKYARYLHWHVSFLRILTKFHVSKMFTTGIYNLLKATHICRHDYYHIIYHIILCLRSDSSFVSQAAPYWKLHAEGWNNLSTHLCSHLAVQLLAVWFQRPSIGASRSWIAG